VTYRLRHSGEIEIGLLGHREAGVVDG